MTINWSMLVEAIDPLAEAKRIKNEEINAARLSANNTFFPYLGKTIACDALSRSDIDGANGVILRDNTLPTHWPGGWKTIENDWIPITTVQEWHEFYNAMYTQGIINFAKAQQLKTALAACTTVEEVKAITW